jgi:hypothetical protein
LLNEEISPEPSGRHDANNRHWTRLFRMFLAVPTPLREVEQRRRCHWADDADPKILRAKMIGRANDPTNVFFVTMM